MRGQEFTEDERETVRRQIGRIRAAADWLEGPGSLRPRSG
ncbi:DUF6192 family protein [Streptomyces mirabilis]